MKSLEVIKKLKPEIHLSTHSSSVAGSAAVEQRLQDYHDALAFVLDQSLMGIPQGKGPDELRYTVELAERLKNAPILVQNYGERSIMPPRITALGAQMGAGASRPRQEPIPRSGERRLISSRMISRIAFLESFPVAV